VDFPQEVLQLWIHLHRQGLYSFYYLGKLHDQVSMYICYLRNNNAHGRKIFVQIKLLIVMEKIGHQD